MSPILAEHPVASPRNRLETVRPTQAKAQLKNLEIRDQVGRAIARAFALAAWSQKEAAAAIGRDTAQIARWIAGTERAQLDAIFAVEQLRQPLVIALSELAGMQVETTIRSVR